MLEDVAEDDGVEEYKDDVIVKDLTDEEGEVGTEIPLPDIVGGEEEREQLGGTTGDQSLSELREWAKKGKKGYSFDDGLLVHTIISPSEQIHKRIVVSSSRRKELLKLAHTNILGGHFPMVRPMDS